jgi:hypothetical protein
MSHGRDLNQVSALSGKPASFDLALGVTFIDLSQSKCNECELYMTKVACQVFINALGDCQVSLTPDRILILAPQAHPRSCLGGTDEFDAQTLKCPSNLIKRS